ncbi:MULTISPECIES: alpha/beta fold hydrolase [Acinetobacter]|uniref:Soluble epoxide hydrolase n=1 Tax=Acinetobacter calcoaceticus TaxID=471 RepID=A0A446ZLB3_ACICA|nr:MULTISPECIES: alpha/beta hydrolase [Acinetobacter]MEB3865007.1 alpha/beta hydrolase [Acinetobacter sp. IK31]VAX45191.1 Soluble epoxide hydrolase [Acinetobacter calcoaceticus]
MKTHLFNENSYNEFQHHYTHIESKKLHYVTLGEGPAVLLIPGWPQTWYAWHKVMIELAKQGYQAIAVDLPGTGNSAPLDGSYDTGRIAKILSMLMTELEYPTYSVVGHDIGMWVAYALASDFPESVTRLAVTEAVIPGLAPAPPIFVEPSENIFLWHFMFNQTLDLPEALIAGREDTYLNYMFDKWSWHKDKVAIETYIEAYKIPGRLTAGFNYYRSIPETIRQNKIRETKSLDMPVLAIGAEHATDNAPYETMKKVSPHLTSTIVKDCGHFIMEEQSEKFSSLILDFLQQEKSDASTC